MYCNDNQVDVDRYDQRKGNLEFLQFFEVELGDLSILEGTLVVPSFVAALLSKYFYLFNSLLSSKS